MTHALPELRPLTALAARGGAVLAFGLLTACGGSDPADPDASGRDSFYPIAVGHEWIYEEDNAGTLDVITKKITKTEKLEGDETFVQRTTQTKHDVVKTTNLRIEGSRVDRVLQQSFENDVLTSRNVYVPGFLRFDHELTSPGQTLQGSHIRKEYDGDGTLIREPTDSFTWLLEAVDAEVKVPAGTFKDCRQIRRIDLGSEEIKRFYYAAGVGKVLETLVDANGDITDREALKSYELAE